MRYRILGAVQVWHDERPLAIGGPQQRALLALLLLSANRVVSIDRLTADLWNDHPANARALVQGCVARLRRVLGVAGADTQPLSTCPPGYLLRVGPGELDLDRFEELAAAGSRLAASNSTPALRQATELLTAALALWEGPALSDIDLAACRTAAAGLEERRLAALEERVAIDIRLGRHTRVVGELQAHAAAYPMRERARALLMTALHRGGRQAEALAVYADTRRLLVDELGIEPGPELRRLQGDILANREAAVAGPVEPGAAAAPPTPRQLPPPVRHFAGRADELAALTTVLDEAAADGGTVVISAIAGTAGVGKTALAVHWAHRTADRFPDGQLYVNLRGFDPAGSVVPSADAVRGFLDALDVPPHRIPADLAAQTALYRSMIAGRRVLVVLDNARDSEQVRPLLPGSPGCLAIVTSRNELSSLVTAEGAHPITLDVLPAADAHDLIAQRIGPRRAAAEPDAVNEIINRCAGLPLALAIVASRATSHSGFPLAALAGELRRTAGRLDAFTDHEPATDIRAVFACSYRTLSDDAARLFRLIGLHPGPDISVGAAAGLAGLPTDRIRAHLTELAHAHLLTEHAPGRFAAHDLLRDFAAERARAIDADAGRAAAVGRVLDWYRYAADAAVRSLYPHMLRLRQPPVHAPASAPEFRDGAEALAWLDAERRNLLAIARYAADNGPRPVAWLLADALRPYFTARMYVADWLEVATVGLHAARAERDIAAEAAAELSLANAYQSVSRYPQAIEHYTRALALAREAGWIDGQAAVLGNLGNVYMFLGRLPDAADLFATALTLHEQTGQVADQARSLGGSGIVLSHLGRLPEAADHLLRALELFRRLGSRRYEAVALTSLGEVYHDLGQLDIAAEHLIRALDLLRETGDDRGEANALRHLAAVYRDTGDHRHALTLVDAALNLVRDAGDRWVEAHTLNARAFIEQRLGQHRSARDNHRRALDIGRRTDNMYPQIAALVGLVAAHQHLGEVCDARTCADEAIAISRRHGYRLMEGQALAALAAVDIDEGRYVPAIERARQALDIQRDTGHRPGIARAHLLLGHALRPDDPAAAAVHWHEAHDLFAEIGTPDADDVRTLLRHQYTG
jgi:DNA-binding SARP family transcriptional activator/tetratricopeptide (TPR) repeat protein